MRCECGPAGCPSPSSRWPRLLGIMAGSVSAQGPTKIRYALGDVVGIDDLPLLIAAERAKARGVEVEITPFKSEEIATQAVINGQADIGQGTPYAALQKVTVPIRFFYQLSTLQFFPIVSKEQLQDLEGPGRPGHRRAGARLGNRGDHGARRQAARDQVQEHQLRARARRSAACALLKGTIKATILDAPNKSS